MGRKRPAGARRLTVCERFGLEAGTLWTPVPLALRRLAKDRGLSLAAYVVLIEIIDVYEPAFGGLVPFSASAVARRLPLDRRYVGRILDELVASGLIAIERPKGGHVVLHVEPLLLALRLAASTTGGRSWLPMLQHTAGDLRAQAQGDALRSAGGVRSGAQGGARGGAPAGSAEMLEELEEETRRGARFIAAARSKAGMSEPAAIRDILAADGKLPRRANL